MGSFPPLIKNCKGYIFWLCWHKGAINIKYGLMLIKFVKNNAINLHFWDFKRNENIFMGTKRYILGSKLSAIYV